MQEVQLIIRVLGLYVYVIFLLICQLEGLWFSIHCERFWWLRTLPQNRSKRSGLQCFEAGNKNLNFNIFLKRILDWRLSGNNWNKFMSVKIQNYFFPCLTDKIFSKYLVRRFNPISLKKKLSFLNIWSYLLRKKYLLNIWSYPIRKIGNSQIREWLRKLEIALIFAWQAYLSHYLSGQFSQLFSGFWRFSSAKIAFLSLNFYVRKTFKVCT